MAWGRRADIRLIGIVSLVGLLPLAGCALQRAQLAENARVKMVGMTKEDVLRCMGPPSQKQSEGHTEVWSYASGNGATTVFGSSSANTTGSVTGFGNTANVSAVTNGTSFATASKRYCTVDVVMADGRVDRINYSGPTGGLITEGEQCAFAVKNCVQ